MESNQRKLTTQVTPKHAQSRACAVNGEQETSDMFQENEIVKVDLKAYKAWYRANVRSGVWFFDDCEICYVESVYDYDGVPHASVHGVCKPYGAGIPVEFLTSETFQFDWWRQSNNWTHDVWEHEPTQADFDARRTEEETAPTDLSDIPF